MIPVMDLQQDHPTLFVGEHRWVWDGQHYQLNGPSCTTWAHAVPLQDVESLAAVVPRAFWPAPRSWPIKAHGDTFEFHADHIRLQFCARMPHHYAHMVDVLMLAASAQAERGRRR